MKFDVCFRHDDRNEDQWITVTAGDRHEAIAEARKHVDRDNWHHYGIRKSNP